MPGSRGQLSNEAFKDQYSDLKPRLIYIQSHSSPAPVCHYYSVASPCLAADDDRSSSDKSYTSIHHIRTSGISLNAWTRLPKTVTRLRQVLVLLVLPSSIEKKQVKADRAETDIFTVQSQANCYIVRVNRKLEPVIYITAFVRLFFGLTLRYNAGRKRKAGRLFTCSSLKSWRCCLSLFRCWCSLGCQGC